MTSYDALVISSLPIFDQMVDFDPARDFSTFLKGIPAKWVVYLLTDAADRPVQLLCVKNLRYSLERRLDPTPTEERTKRVDYRDLVRRIHWRRVDSAFEADFIYWAIARALFPQSYRGMMVHRPAWFIHVDPSAEFPRFVQTTDLSTKSEGLLIGPVEDKHVAQRLIQSAEDAFDLCRYYNVLTAAPAGKACAYKEMGRCPAPCDGTVSMDHYRQQVTIATQAIIDPSHALRDQTARMKQAAAELKFKLAGRIKSRIDQITSFATGPFRHARPIADFQFCSLQRGPRPGTAKLFLITPAGVEEIAGLIAEPRSASDLLRFLLAVAAESSAVLDATATERIGLVSHHLFLPKQTQGLFLRISEITGDSLAQAYRDLKRQKEPEVTEASEGVIREANATLPPAVS
ncbi:MAG TPA: hypothetical protein VFE58_16805 [Tepidisphaeraceae bacterium]|nr:hypothetical protein [Tepidisphaeraceae bacterium]